MPVKKQQPKSKLLLISQSIVKGLYKYLWKGECGVYFDKVYLTKEVKSEPSEAMQLGHFFEFEATGMKPAHGDPVPEPERLSRNSTSAKFGPRKKGDLKDKWLIAKKQAIIFKWFCRQMGIKIIAAGTEIQVDGMTGTLDIKAVWVNAPKETQQWVAFYFPELDPGAFEFIIDLKFSGLLDNKWDDLGWDPDAIASKPSHMIQATHYSCLDPGIPFVFWVWSPTTLYENEMFWINIDPESIDSYKKEIGTIREQIKLEYNKGGFKARPSYRKCKKCVAAEGCEFKHNYPEPIRIDYTFGS